VDAIETHDCDVLVIGAGGAGLRAAIEASTLGCRVALVTKSLLGKAHTVMAEGGVAAALAHVDPQDGWQVHFRDTMKGGSFLNHWRMAQLHAQEAPDRVRELERWGGVFDRTPDRKMSQRAFGGHTYRRLVHIGDRTGLELIRTLQDKCVHQDVDVFMECTVTRLLKDGPRVCGAFGYRRATGELVVLPLHPGMEIDVREHAFLLSSHHISYSFIRIKGLRNILFGGQGMFMDRFVTTNEPGMLMLHGYGNVFERVLKPGESILVEPGAFLYKDASVTMDVEFQSLTTGWFGGTGMSLARMTGPGRVGIQSMYVHHTTE